MTAKNLRCIGEKQYIAPHQTVKCRPSTESQTRTRLSEFAETVRNHSHRKMEDIHINYNTSVTIKISYLLHISNNRDSKKIHMNTKRLKKLTTTYASQLTQREHATKVHE